MKERHKKILAKIGNILSLLILILAIGLLSYVTICKLTRKTPQLFGYSFHFVLTPSMEPDIMTGDFVIGKKISLEELYENNQDKADKDKDVVLFVSPNPADNGIVIVHKIRRIEITDDGYKIYTYGVNNAIDDAIPTTEVIGKVVHVSGFLGKVFNPIGIIFLLVIIVILIVFYFGIVSFLKNYRELKAEKEGITVEQQEVENKINDVTEIVSDASSSKLSAQKEIPPDKKPK